MHELSIASAVVNTAEKHAAGTARGGGDHDHRRAPPGGARLARVLLRDRGPRHASCEGARLEQRLVAARLRCEDCGQEWEPEVPAFRCPGCESARVEMLGGNELEVESIEIEEEAACTAPR